MTGSSLLCAMKTEHAPSELIHVSLEVDLRDLVDTRPNAAAAVVRAITSINAAVLAEVQTTTAEQFTFTTWVRLHHHFTLLPLCSNRFAFILLVRRTGIPWRVGW